MNIYYCREEPGEPRDVLVNKLAWISTIVEFYISPETSIFVNKLTWISTIVEMITVQS